MTATELQSIVRRLANQTWCRYWLNFHERHENVVMAIQCLESSRNGFEPVRLKCLEDAGFELYGTTTEPLKFIYTIPRTNEDGTPFVSKLF